MMESVPLPEILNHLSRILSGTPNLSSSPTPVLPPSIPPLPSTSTTLPATPSSTPLSSLTTYLQTHILPYLSQSSLSPNYYGFVTGGNTPASLLADLLVSIYDQNCAVHLPTEAITTTLEVATLNQLLALFNLPLREWGIGAAAAGGGNGSGVFTTGATASNVLGMAMGREFVLSEAVRRKTGRRMSCAQHGVYETMMAGGVREVVVLSSLPHSSIGKAAAVVGLGRGAVRSVRREGTACGIDLEALKREVSVEGRGSVLVVSAGEVNTGRFATGTGVMAQARRICDEAGVWVHVDGAFGLFARVLQAEKGFEEVVSGVDGVELADSITGDGHKLLNVPYDCGFFFTRHKALAEEVFSNGSAAYLTSGMSEDGGGIQSPLNIGLENSRRFRALPVHAALVTYGREGYVDMLKRQIGLASRVTKWLKGRKEYEVLPRGADVEEMVKQTFMIVLFRAKDDEINNVLAKRINATGKMYVTGTNWEGETAVRIAISNWQVDIERDCRLIEEVLDDVVRP